MNYLKPDVCKTDWSLDEDVQLTELLNTYGTNWKIIEQQLKGRSQNQIKNRYFGRLKKLHEKKLKTLPKEQPQPNK